MVELCYPRGNIRHTCKVNCAKPQRQGREAWSQPKSRQENVPWLSELVFLAWSHRACRCRLSFKKRVSKAGIGTGEMGSAPLSPRMLSRRVLSGLLWPQCQRLGRSCSLCLFLCPVWMECQSSNSVGSRKFEVRRETWSWTLILGF